MNYGILPNLTKDYILKQITQENIFEYYLGISVTTDGLIKCPPVIRAGDKKPTCSFYYSNNGKLRLRDWAGYFWGDCFDVVAYILRVDSKDKKGFGVILDQISRDFKLHKYKDSSYITTGSTFDERDVNTKIKKGKALFQFQPRNWLKQDADFWLAGNINSKLLKIGRVYPVLYAWINKNLVYNFNPKDPCYAYYFAPEDIKFYFPARQTYRFLGNSSYLQGIDLFEPDRFGIITKSYKDVLSMKSFDLQAIAPSSESVPLKQDEWISIKHKCDFYVSLYDFDRQGVIMSNKLRKLYNIQPLFFTTRFPKFSTKHYRAFKGIKDFYDFVKKYGKNATIDLIEDTKDHFNNQLDNHQDYEELDNLKNPF